MLRYTFLTGSASLRPGRAFVAAFSRRAVRRWGGGCEANTQRCYRSSTSHIARTTPTRAPSYHRRSVTSLAAKDIIGTPTSTFDDGKSPYQITTPIYYVNDKPHIGHAYTSIACDIIARFMRLSGRSVFFLTGTDEHGQKVEESAAARHIPPQQFADEVSKTFREMLDLLNISSDKFIRTTDDHHKKAVQHLWKTLADKGAIYLGAYEGWYSVRDECYYTESELIDGKAPTGSEVRWVVKEPSYFFKLSAFEDKLLKYYDSNPDFIAPQSRRNEVVAFVKSGLKDLSISRTTFKWGVPVPDDDDHVMYVWVDALANYISALGYPDGSWQQSPSNRANATTETAVKAEGTGKSMTSTSAMTLDLDRKLHDSDFIKFWPAALHVVGKDILRFHAIYWPAILMAADLPVPKRIFAHGWWTKDGEKISKSLGNVIDPLELVEKYGVDQTRFFLMADVTFGADGDFSHEKMVLKINANLANEIGNLCQRTLTLIFKNCDKAVPSEIGPYTHDDETLLGSAKALHGKAAAALSIQAIHKYVDAVVAMVWEANQYIDKMEPWALKKTDLKRMATVLYVLMEVLRRVAILYQPLIPTSANKILDQLAVPEDERTFAHLETCPIKFGAKISRPVGIFPRLHVPDTQS